MNTIFVKVYGVAAVAAFLLFASGSALAWLRIVPPMTGFGMFALGCLLGVVVTIVGIVAILMGKTGPVVALWFLGAIPAGFLVYGMVSGRNYPLINDISTDVADPPTFVRAQQLPENDGWEMAFPAENGELVLEHYPQVKSLPLAGTIDDVFGRAQQLATGEEDWTILGTDTGEKRRTIEGYSETGLFHFRDYFVIEIREIDDGAVVVDMRSKSKDGRGDFGVNAARIREFLEKLKA